MDDNSPYSAISDRIAFKDLETKSLVVGETDKDNNKSFSVYRGDCYIC